MMTEPHRGIRSQFLCGTHIGAHDAEPAEVLEQLLLRLMWLEQKRLAHILVVHGLTVSQFVVLASIWERHQGCQMGELAEEMLQSSATMTGIVDRLVRMELVQRQTVANDRRVVVIDLTERGRAMLTAVRQQKLREIQQILDAMAAAERTALVHGLRVYLEVSTAQT